MSSEYSKHIPREGRLVSEGSFSVNPERLREKIATLALHKNHFLLCLLQGLVSCGSSCLNFEFASRQVVLEFDRELPDPVLDDLWSGLWTDYTNPECRGRHFLSFGIAAALLDGFSHVTCRGRRYSKPGLAPELIQTADPKRIYLQVPLVRTLFDPRMRKLRESLLNVLEKKWGCGADLSFEGRKIDPIKPLGPMVSLTSHYGQSPIMPGYTGPPATVQFFFDASTAGLVYYCSSGVRVKKKRLRSITGVTTIVSSDALKLDASKTSMVREPRLEAFVQWAWLQTLLNLKASDINHRNRDSVSTILKWLHKTIALEQEQRDRVLAHLKSLSSISVKKGKSSLEPDKKVPTVIHDSHRNGAVQLLWSKAKVKRGRVRVKFEGDTKDWVEFDFSKGVILESRGGAREAFRPRKIKLDQVDRLRDEKRITLYWLYLSDGKATRTYKGEDRDYFGDRSPDRGRRLPTDGEQIMILYDRLLALS
jgi:hypothetical protein